MKKLIQITLPLLVLLIAITAIKSPSAPAASTLKEGDIVFQTSKSSQSKYIKLATQSPWTHCGIIIEKPDDLYVLEAISTVSLTSYGQWVARGKDKRVGVKRYSDDSIKIKYFKASPTTRPSSSITGSGIAQNWSMTSTSDNSEWNCASPAPSAIMPSAAWEKSSPSAASTKVSLWSLPMTFMNQNGY